MSITRMKKGANSPRALIVLLPRHDGQRHTSRLQIPISLFTAPPFSHLSVCVGVKRATTRYGYIIVRSTLVSNRFGLWCIGPRVLHIFFPELQGGKIVCRNWMERSVGLSVPFCLAAEAIYVWKENADVTSALEFGEFVFLSGRALFSFSSARKRWRLSFLRPFIAAAVPSFYFLNCIRII